MILFTTTILLLPIIYRLEAGSDYSISGMILCLGDENSWQAAYGCPTRLIVKRDMPLPLYCGHDVFSVAG